MRHTHAYLDSTLYETFHHAVRVACRRIGRRRRPGLVAIAALRRAIPALPRNVFDQYLLRMERNEIVHLLTTDDPSGLSDDERNDALVGTRGALHAFLLYIGARRRPAVLWD
jgi:hypothetical protein